MASLILHAKAAIHSVGRKYINHLCQDEAARQTPKHNERPIEFGFALRCMAEQHPTTVLDVGTGTTAWPHILRNCGYVVTALDNVKDYWPVGMQNRHWPVENVDITNLNGFKGRHFDSVTCISVLEHITDHRAAMANMLSMLAPGDGWSSPHRSATSTRTQTPSNTPVTRISARRWTTFADPTGLGTCNRGRS
jgi:2-polyprenyl-3-methyl-5-hydroxy-6-metoxy-1,4-benzoquinol methylase